MSVLKLFVLLLFFWETGEMEFGPIVFLIIYLAVSGTEVFFSVSELGGLMFLLGLLGGMGVLMSFLLKLCSPTKVELSLPSLGTSVTFPIFIVCIAVEGHTLGMQPKLVSVTPPINLFFMGEGASEHSGQLTAVVFLITFLMVMLLVVEAVLCHKQKGLL
uniref:NADH dehydrogenase subunit 6 n=1 Tax=Hoplopleura sp. TaxID=2782173 RepID=A0A7S8WWA1_9NEOP|nr:NADH dehydrogenase subunit 6 [Hoplopleura sp.]